MSAPSVRPAATIAAGDLALERWRRDDLDALLAAVASTLDHLRPWMSWAARYGRDSAAQFLAACEVGWRRGERFEYAIRNPDRAIVGSAGLMHRIAPGGLEIGYRVHVAHARQGIATRAVRALTGAAFGLGWVTHVEIHHDEANVASGAIPARLGFRRVDAALRERSAPAEVGREVRWRIDAETFVAAPELP